MNPYGIYVMATIIEQHCGLHGDAMDLHWEFSAAHYANFYRSRWDDEDLSQADCIETYVKHQSENDPNWLNPD